MGYGVGQGLAEGVQMAGSFLMPAMRAKQQQKQFDTEMGQRSKQRQDTLDMHHDRMALEQAWVDRFSPSEPAQASLPPDAFPKMPAQPAQAQQPLPPDAFPRVPATPAQALLPTPTPQAVNAPSVRVNPNTALPSPYEIRPRFRRY